LPQRLCASEHPMHRSGAHKAKTIQHMFAMHNANVN